VSTHVVHRAGVALTVHEAGEGIPVLLLHGLTATHRYVVMGSTRLQRAGHRVISYDARGHGASSPAPDASAYGYEELALDAVAVLDQLSIPRAVLAGASMGARRARLPRPRGGRSCHNACLRTGERR
jgi:3-oxoadipate enol-lactonase